MKPQHLSTGISEEYIRQRIEELSPWYHKFDLGNDIVTLGRDFEKYWNPIKRVMDTIDYNGKRVLDLASWDGMWAFEAEKRGASFVVASDTRVQGCENLLFIKEVTGSKVIPLFNVPAQNIQSRLKIVGMHEKFDIIQHFGLFYHLRDPLLSLSQCRQVISEVLIRSFFRLVNEDKWQQYLPKLSKRNTVGRITVIAHVLPKNEGEQVDVHKVFGYQ